jgi:TorA maturation chaperone TorD
MKPARRSLPPRQSSSPVLERAYAFRLLAEAFGYPVPGHTRRVARMFGRLARPNGDRPALRRALARAECAWAAADEERLAADYARLFLGAGACSLHETAYGDARRIAGRTAELADIAGFYAAFGFALADTDRDLPDHLCAELEFYSAMLLKSAYAGRRGWTERGKVVAHALRKFLEDHLARWTGALAAEIARVGGHSPYGALAALAAALVADETRRLRAHPKPFAGRPGADFMQAEEFACPQEAATGARA